MPTEADLNKLQIADLSGMSALESLPRGPSTGILTYLVIY